jgi:putative endonuclease
VTRTGRAALTSRARGQIGEALAAAALTQRGYTILARNWRCEAGELDIIARHADTLVFVEVRSTWDNPELALESVDARKLVRVASLADRYLAEHGLEDAAHRIDVVAVNRRTGAVEVLQDASDW